MSERPLVLLVQLPIPPPGPGPVEGNVPLAAAYLKLFARRQGLDALYDIELLPPALTNALGDQALLRAILLRQPWMVAFTCYLWNIERTLWIAQQLRAVRPDLRIVVGGPEITPDNNWALERLVGQIDNLPKQVKDLPGGGTYAVFGEGEATFAELLTSLAEKKADRVIPGLWQPAHPAPPARAALTNLDCVSSPYAEGILDLCDSRQMLFETARGCRFGCKYCYYSKGNASLRFLSADQVLANLRYAIQHGADEVVLLDPTLNQRSDFLDFLALLRRANSSGRLRFSAELRAEGVDAATAHLLRQTGFDEVEIGLQSIDPQALRLMGRPTNLVTLERGVRAMLDEGIKVRMDLILGLPGDSADSIRRGIDFLRERQLYTEVQVFNLSILPGTAFRHEAEQLGIKYQPRPPYYVLRTPTLDVEMLCGLMEEAQDAFNTEFDPLPPLRPELFSAGDDASRGCLIDLDAATADLPSETALCFTLCLRSADFYQRREQAAALIAKLLDANPHTTLHVQLEPTGDPQRLTPETVELVFATCYRAASYLDRYYSMHPGERLGSKRLSILLSPQHLSTVDSRWREAVSQFAEIPGSGGRDA